MTQRTGREEFSHRAGGACHTVCVPARFAPPLAFVITLLVNPAAGQGRAALRANAVERALGVYAPVRRVETARAGDERRLAREAAESGARVLAVVGGDGSVHHAAHGLLDARADGRPEVALAVFAAGTGNDFVKSIGTPAHDVDAMAARVGRGATQLVDVGYIDTVPFLNAAGFGFDVEVLRRMQAPSMFRGTAQYVMTALGALLGYRGFRAALAAGTTAERALMHRRLMTVVANGRWFGGAFQIAPEASLSDGALDIVDFGDVSALGRLPLFAGATRGTHVRSRHVAVQRGAAFTLEFEQPPAFEADGELCQADGPVVSIRLKPNALRLVV